MSDTKPKEPKRKRGDGKQIKAENRNTFVYQFHEFLQKHRELIHWNPEGTVVVIEDENKAFKEALVEIMKNKKQGSFTRQLHLYRFKRLTDGRSRKHPKGYSEFFHKNFTRDSPASLDLMSRIPDKKGKQKRGRAAKSSEEPSPRKKKATANGISLLNNVATPTMVGAQVPLPVNYSDLVKMQVFSIAQPVAQPSVPMMISTPLSANVEQAAVQNLPGQAFGFGDADLHNQVFQNSLQSISFPEQVYPRLYSNELVQARGRVGILGEVMNNTINQYPYPYQMNPCGPYSAPIVPNNPALQFGPTVNMHHLQAIYNGQIDGINSAQPALTLMAPSNGFDPSAIDNFGGLLNMPSPAALQHGLSGMPPAISNATAATCNPKLIFTTQSHDIFPQAKDNEVLSITGDMVPATVPQEVLLFNKDDIRLHSLEYQYETIAPPPMPMRLASSDDSSSNTSITSNTACMPSSESGDLDLNPLESNSCWTMSGFLEE